MRGNLAAPLAAFFCPKCSPYGSMYALLGFKLRPNPLQSCLPLVSRGALSIKRFETLVVFEKQECMVYFTLKETVGSGHKIYSLELKEIKKNRTQGGTPQERTTSGYTSLSTDSSEKSTK
jgi:hypothetical protein